jgi:hypothetical protein
MLELFGFICCMYLLYKYVEKDQESNQDSVSTSKPRKKK